VDVSLSEVREWAGRLDIHVDESIAQDEIEALIIDEITTRLERIVGERGRSMGEDLNIEFISEVFTVFVNEAGLGGSNISQWYLDVLTNASQAAVDVWVEELGIMLNGDESLEEILYSIIPQEIARREAAGGTLHLSRSLRQWYESLKTESA
jgi:hypothetical protein